jgi:hypothetical protein
MDTDECQHPECKGSRATTTHIFWECKAFDGTRRKYQKVIDRKLELTKKWDRAAHTEIKRILANNCFQNCAICPSNPEQLKSTYELEDNDPHKLPTHKDDMCTGDPGSYTIDINGFKYFKVYTDGSVENGKSRELARAGWGVFHAPNSKFNHCSKLHGPVQTSYRAEVRALLHVFSDHGSSLLRHG